MSQDQVHEPLGGRGFPPLCRATWEPLWCLDIHCRRRGRPEHKHRCTAVTHCRFCAQCARHCQCVDIDVSDL